MRGLPMESSFDRHLAGCPFTVTLAASCRCAGHSSRIPKGTLQIRDSIMNVSVSPVRFHATLTSGCVIAA